MVVADRRIDMPCQSRRAPSFRCDGYLVAIVTWLRPTGSACAGLRPCRQV